MRTRTASDARAAGAAGTADGVGPEQAATDTAGFGARRALALLVLLAALVLVLLLSLAVGASMTSLEASWRGLVHPDGSDASLIVWTLRVPRTLLAIVAGIAFAVAGALIQAITRNPLADPGILGVNAGAGFAVTLAIGLLGVHSGMGIMWAAFTGALAATVVVHAVSSGRRGTASPVTLVLAGVALSAVLGGFSTALQLFDPETFRSLRRWGLGTVAVTDLTGVRTLLPFVLVALVIALVIAPSLNAIALGDELAATLGTRIVRTRVLGVLAITLLAGGATALTGGIGFVGLMVPHVVRWATGPDQRWILACSAIGGAVLVLAADVLARVLVVPSELEVGLVTSVIGAPVLIALVRRRRASGL